MLGVYAPLISGRNVNPWPRLTNSSHLSEWCQEISLNKNVKAWILRATHHEPPHHQPSDDFAHLCTLGRSLIEDRLRHLKIYDVVYASLFTYDHNSDIVKAFCEAWCPLTNTLLTSSGELSISLWDLHELVGLPMTGCLYDEVVPSALELTGVVEKRERFIPRSNKYLLYAYHLLQSADNNRCSHVSIDNWVKFWSKKATKYHPPPPRKEKKTVWLKLTHNPLGDIAIHERWSTAEEALFAKLCIERSFKEAVYLAAYLACWLCVFVLPGKDINSVRPSTFKMASSMANGRRVNLSIPILASIYEGLNVVATSPKPVDGPFKFVDDGHAEELDHSYFIAIHSSYLTLRQVGRFIIELYSPHRFERQFGYYQDLEDEIQSIDVGEEFKTSHLSNITPPIGMGLRRKQSPPPAASISNTTVDFLSSIEDDVYLILESMTSFQKFYVSKVEESLNTFFAKVRTYDESRSLSFKKLSRSLHEQQLKEAKARLQDVQAKVSEEASKIQSAMDDLEHVEEDIVVLKGRRTSLCATSKGKK
ncbi:UNVERIFIED_CONTAM: hypothetical protein Scaly_0483200 [Sesamum calycinum]|uniref:Aminotransferase-like plant mobile domain-containing protein n=1 Tax=Sesamum calycinum TaxID=2727403 RepID=A0AAW2RPH5_9LAMI